MTQEITSRHEAVGPLDKIIIYPPTLPPAQLGPARPGLAWLGLGSASASLGLGLLLAYRRVPVASCQFVLRRLGAGAGATLI